jgi:hypothetical protein
MKKLLLILVLTIVSCNQPDSVYYHCRDSKIVILKKDVIHGSRGGVSYNLYVFDGETAQNYWTNEETFNNYSEGDTLNTLFLSKSESYTKK